MAISDNDRHDAYLRRFRPPVLDVENIVAMLRRRAAFIAAVTLVCAGLSLVYILLSPPRYVATGRILIDPPATRSNGTADSAVAFDHQINVMMSRSVLDKVIAREKLEADPRFGARSRGILTALLAGVGLVPAADPHAMALRQLSRAITVTRSPGSSVVSVDAVTSDRETSSRVINAVMDSYVEDVAGVSPGLMPRVNAPADAAREKLQTRLRDAEQALQTYRQDNRISGTGGQSATESHSAELPGQITAAEGKVAALRATLAKVQRARDERDLTVIPEALRSRAFEALRTRYIAASRREANLSETLGSRHPRLKPAEQEMAKASRMLDQAIGDMVQSTSTELERSRSVVTRLKARLESSKSDTTISRDTPGRLRELERDVEISRAAYQALLSRTREPEPQQRSENIGPRIEVRATPPQERSGASPVRTLLVSLILGLGLALSLAWLLELMNERKAKALLR